MKIITISDTHTKHEELNNDLPYADMIIHCGDFTSLGKEIEIINYMEWYSALDQYKYKLIIAGNHDWMFETNSQLAKSLIPDNIIYLEDSGIEIEGFNFYGTPVSKPFFDWAFNRPEDKLKKHWEAIPDDTDVLITHSPPWSILDYVPFSNNNGGSPTLHQEIFNRLKNNLKLSVFGHIHEGYGEKEIDGIKFINASNLNRNYKYTNKPILYEI